MTNQTQTLLAQAVTKILRPLIRILLRNGVACGNLEDLVRKTYVEEAFAMAEQAGKKVTVSSVSAQTGLSRKEVKRLNELDEELSSTGAQKYNRAIRVISGWLNDRHYTNTDGQALPLPLVNDNGVSFSDLIKQYSGDITPKAMLDLLDSSGCIQVSDDTVHLIKHAYVPGNDSEEIIKILGNDTSELITTIDHNLTCEADEKYYQRKVSTSLLKKSSTDKFRDYSRRRSQALLEELDIWLTDHASTDADEEKQYISVGIYYYQPDNEKQTNENKN